ncbi:MAG: Verru_Chthon cassette protein C, partial [Prosthecobacter sp.]|nr:Verru_Chthon cassette protein C [Prosthecobacter sp.]
MTASLPRSLLCKEWRSSCRAAFTLVEILVSLTVLSILLLISAQVIGQVQTTWSASNARISQFREARTAFDILTRNLSQATLNTYIDYDTNYLSNVATAATAAAPNKYLRKSDLQFRCGPAEDLVKGAGGAGEDYLPGDAVFFQAPLGIAQQPGLVGLDRLLCGRGYFVQFSNDAFFRPEWLPPGILRNRYRLMEFSPPAEKNLIYSSTAANPWFADAGAPMDPEESAVNLSLNRPVADNIVSLIISPRLERAVTSINGTAAFDSVPTPSTDDPGAKPGTGAQATRHLLPPMLKIILVAIDERSAERLSNGDTD